MKSKIITKESLLNENKSEEICFLISKDLLDLEYTQLNCLTIFKAHQKEIQNYVGVIVVDDLGHSYQISKIEGNKDLNIHLVEYDLDFEIFKKLIINYIKEHKNYLSHSETDYLEESLSYVVRKEIVNELNLRLNYKDMFNALNIKDIYFTYGTENVECLSDFKYKKNVVVEKTFIDKHKVKAILFSMLLIVLLLCYIYFQEFVIMLIGLTLFILTFIITEKFSKKEHVEKIKKINNNSIFIMKYEEKEEFFEVITTDESSICEELDYYEFNEDKLYLIKNEKRILIENEEESLKEIKRLLIIQLEIFYEIDGVFDLLVMKSLKNIENKINKSKTVKELLDYYGTIKEEDK